MACTCTQNVQLCPVCRASPISWYLGSTNLSSGPLNLRDVHAALAPLSSTGGYMTIKGYIRGAVVAAGVFAISAPAVAQEVADMHDQRRERGVICFTDHFHYGSSAGQSTKRAAQIAAVQSWAGFVDFEYGGAWTSWAKSGSKSIKCGRDGGAWSCDVSARPCRRR